MKRIFTLLIILIASVSYGQTATDIKERVDSNVTYKTNARSIRQDSLGNVMKAIIDFANTSGGGDGVSQSTLNDTAQDIRSDIPVIPKITNPNSFLIEERREPYLNFPPDTTNHISLYVPNMVKVGDSLIILGKMDRTQQIAAFLDTTLGDADTAQYIKIAIPKQPSVSGLERTRDPVIFYDSTTEIGQVYYKGLINIYRDTFTRADAFNYYPTNGENPVYDTADARADFGIDGERTITDLAPGNYFRYNDSSYLYITMGMDNPAEYWVVMLSSADDINWTGRRIIAYPKMPYNQVLAPVVFRLKNQYSDDSLWYYSYPTSSEMMGDKTFSVVSYSKTLYSQVYHLEGSMFYPTWDTTVFSNTKNYLSSILMKPDANGYNPYVYDNGNWLAAVSGTKSDGITSERASLAKVYPTDYGKKDVNADTVTAYKVSARVVKADELQGAALDYLSGVYEPLGTSVLIDGNDLSDMSIGILQQGKFNIDIDEEPMMSLFLSSSTLTIAINESYKSLQYNIFGNSASSVNVLNTTPSTGSGSEAGPGTWFYQRNSADNSWLDYGRILPVYTGTGSNKAGGFTFYSRAGGGWITGMDIFSRVQVYTGLVISNTQYALGSNPPNGSKLYISESFSNLHNPIYVQNNSSSNHALIRAEGNVSYAFYEGNSIRSFMKHDFTANEVYWSNLEYDGSGGRNIGLDGSGVFRHRNAGGTTVFSNDASGNTYTLGTSTIVDIPNGAATDSQLVSNNGLVSKVLPWNYNTGWADYTDQTYTTGSPFSLTAGTKYTLYNHADVIRDSQMPVDIDSMYSRTDSTITGRNGDGLNVLIEFKVRPTTATVTKLTVTIDIGGSVGEIYPRDFILTKGNGVEHYYVSSFAAYTLDTWETNGGKVKVQVDNAAEIYDIRYVLTRTHKAR